MFFESQNILNLSKIIKKNYNLKYVYYENIVNK
jgi:hypothetical protein